MIKDSSGDCLQTSERRTVWPDDSRDTRDCERVLEDNNQMFESVVIEYLDKTLSKDWSILGILEFARPKLSPDTINNFKEDLYVVLRGYLEKCNVHVNAKKKVKKILTNFNTYFSIDKVRQFIIELEYNTETRMNVTSAYTIEVLKDQQDNRKLINQLREDISSINSNLEDGQEQVNVQVTCDRIASLRSADPSTGASQSNFQEDGEKDEEENEEEDEDEEEEKDEDNATNNNANYVAKKNFPENNYDHNDDFVEVTYVDSLECQSRTSRWLLSSGTDVLNVLSKYEKIVPENQKCLNPVCWGILDLTGAHPETKALFSPEDWAEMVNNFKQEVKLSQTDIPKIVIHFFDEVNQIVKNNHDPTMEIDRLFPEVIEKKYNITLSTEEKVNIFALKRAIVTYIENLKGADLLVSESDFDNSFPNSLMKRFLDQDEVKIDVGEICCWGSAQRRNEGRSVILRARVGQKCDFRGILKNSVDKLEAIVGLRSGGLPTAHRRKIFEDHIDLSVTMRDILYSFFKSNQNASDDILHRTFLLGTQSWGWTHDVYGMDCKATNICRFGKLCRTKMPHTSETIGCLEAFYAVMLNVKATLKDIREHVNSVALVHSQAHRNGKRKFEDSKVGGCFGEIKTSPRKIRTKYL
ncbi:9231_t:CDS:2 [Funneliformis geosporum]|uniref:9960_t:CDS:1 n=1 Tax=Funneliformis geosporum TaxID=1117311 RepID=A0A9W4T240_9GLOM|nr:9960_t:CDS:2 [Funneliformis geosporum]CAI2190025.1 9231_t:CDS:2 [Funneliformis geosporum]